VMQQSQAVKEAAATAKKLAEAEADAIMNATSDAVAAAAAKDAIDKASVQAKALFQLDEAPKALAKRVPGSDRASLSAVRDSYLACRRRSRPRHLTALYIFFPLASASGRRNRLRRRSVEATEVGAHDAGGQGGRPSLHFHRVPRRAAAGTRREALRATSSTDRVQPSSHLGAARCGRIPKGQTFLSNNSPWRQASSWKSSRRRSKQRRGRSLGALEELSRSDSMVSTFPPLHRRVASSRISSVSLLRRRPGDTAAGRALQGLVAGWFEGLL
jgi:hypothetical protein